MSLMKEAIGGWESHWWYVFHKEVKSRDSTTWFRIWQFKTPAKKQYPQMRLLAEWSIFWGDDRGSLKEGVKNYVTGPMSPLNSPIFSVFTSIVWAIKRVMIRSAPLSWLHFQHLHAQRAEGPCPGTRETRSWLSDQRRGPSRQTPPSEVRPASSCCRRQTCRARGRRTCKSARSGSEASSRATASAGRGRVVCVRRWSPAVGCRRRAPASAAPVSQVNTRQHK